MDGRVKDGSEGVELLVIERLRLLLLSCEHAVQLDPFHTAEGIAFVARALDEHGDAEPFELFLDLGRMVDHRGLEREVAVRVADGFIVRGAVFAGVFDIAVCHGLARRIEIPAVGTGAGERDGIERVERNEEIHCARSDEIDAVERLLKHGNVRAGLRRLLSLGYNEIAVFAADRDERQTALEGIDRELLGVGEFHRAGGGQTGERVIVFSGDGRTAAAAAQQAGQARGGSEICCGSFHLLSGVTEAESKVSV